MADDPVIETLPWPAGAATGVGSLPGDDIVAATRFVVDECPELPHLPELPGRGAGADMIGRAAALMAELHVDLQPSGWRLVDRPGRDERRALDFLDRDLDTLGEVAGEFAGPVKLQVAGPLTLAASLELVRGGPALADTGAVRDLAESLAEGVAAHLADVARRLLGASLLLQVDEPSLPAVLRGRVPTASGFGTLRAVPEQAAQDLLGRVLAAATGAGGWPLLHCCAASPPVRLAVAAGARAVSVDATLLDPGVVDELGEALESGVGLLLGAVPARGPGVPPATRQVADVGRRLWRDIGLDPERLPEQVVVTPACGLAGASVGWAHSAYRVCRQAARALAESPEEEPAR